MSIRAKTQILVSSILLVLTSRPDLGFNKTSDEKAGQNTKFNIQKPFRNRTKRQNQERRNPWSNEFNKNLT